MRKDGFIMLVSEYESMSSFYLAIMFRYLPITSSVVYGMIWNWLDLDVKRLEPFFQLSKPGGATAKESLLLEYPVDFPVVVPIKAVRLR
jgi:Protein of unknown function (DUF3433)